MQMHDARERHPLSPPKGSMPPDVEESMWQLFLAIGSLWDLTDDASQYRLRFDTFLENRIAYNPLYSDFYQAAADMIASLAAQKDLDAAYMLIYFARNPYDLQYNKELMKFVIQTVSNEFINLRMCLGGFKVWGAINYPGYFGGANIPGDPVPYRTAKGLK